MQHSLRFETIVNDGSLYWGKCPQGLLACLPGNGPGKVFRNGVAPKPKSYVKFHITIETSATGRGFCIGALQPKEASIANERPY